MFEYREQYINERIIMGVSVVSFQRGVFRKTECKHSLVLFAFGDLGWGARYGVGSGLPLENV